MTIKRVMSAAPVIVAILCSSVLGWAQSASGGHRKLTVAVVEPLPQGSVGSLGYSVVIGTKKSVTGDQLIRGLSEAKGTHLAILLREDLATGAVLNVVAVASKVGFSEYSVFVFDRKREGMTEIPNFDWRQFSTDEVVVQSLIH